MKWLLVLHIFGVLLFMGNIITAAFWKIRAERGGDLPHLHQTVRNVMIADYVFTGPGIVLLLVTGLLMAHQAGYSLAEINWLTISLGLFAASGLLWLFILLPCQRHMISESKRSVSKGEMTTAYKRASRSWDVFGIIATVIPVVILFLMVTKG